MDMLDRRWIATQIRRTTGVFVTRVLPRGTNLVEDIRRYLPGVQIETILDVGGHHGESVGQFRRAWPNATIHTFEPGAEACDVLEQRHRRDGMVHVHRLALSSEPGTAVPFHVRRVDLNSSLGRTDGHGDEAVVRTELVSVDSLDRWCHAAGVHNVDLLKVDTEGSDLDVLRGATALLSRGAVRLVQVEASMCRDNRKHVPYAEFVSHLEGLDYGLFAIYDQFAFREVRVPLRRANLVFCSLARRTVDDPG